MDTMAVTAAMPITMPRTVRPARSLFFRRARKATRSVSSKFTAGPLRACGVLRLRGSQARCHALPILQRAAGDLGILAVAQAGDDLDRLEQIALDDPHVRRLRFRAASIFSAAEC